MQEHTLFQVFSRMQFQQIFLNLNEFLKGDLENQITRSILRGHFEVPFEYTSQEYAKFPFRKKKQMEFWPFVDYYDEKIVKRAERVKK